MENISLRYDHVLGKYIEKHKKKIIKFTKFVIYNTF